MVYWLTRAASWLAGRVPRPWRLHIAGPLTTLIYFGWAAKRRVTIANMAQVLGTTPDDPRAQRLARISWRNYGRYVSDFFYLPNASRAELLGRMRDITPAPGALGLVDQVQAAGKGMILVSAHFGAWDVAGVYIADHTLLHFVVESFDDPRMDRLVMEQRGKFGIQILRIEKTPRQMLRVLQQNGILGVAIDRPVSEREGVPVTFFGRRCYVPGGIAQLALKTGAAILPGYCRYDSEYSDTFYMGALPPIYPEKTGDKERDVITLMQRIFDALEPVIREYPEQWAMFRAFWPEGADEPPALAQGMAQSSLATSDLAVGAERWSGNDG